MDTGKIEFIGMETRDGHRYFGVYWNGDTRWTHVLWILLRWRLEMGTSLWGLWGCRHEVGKVIV